GSPEGALELLRTIAQARASVRDDRGERGRLAGEGATPRIDSARFLVRAVALRTSLSQNRRAAPDGCRRTGARSQPAGNRRRARTLSHSRRRAGVRAARARILLQAYAAARSPPATSQAVAPTKRRSARLGVDPSRLPLL